MLDNESESFGDNGDWEPADRYPLGAPPVLAPRRASRYSAAAAGAAAAAANHAADEASMQAQLDAATAEVASTRQALAASQLSQQARQREPAPAMAC